jgi:hypothetical protein
MAKEKSKGLTGAGASTVRRPSGAKRPSGSRKILSAEGQPCGKFLAQKAALDVREVALWFREMLERAGGGDGQAAFEARGILERMLVQGCMELEPVALGVEDSEAKAWAGRVLARIGALLEADREKLRKRNAAYLEERAQLGKLLRNDRWFPKNPLYQALHRELWRCEFYRGELIWPRAQHYLPQLKAPMPEEYRPFMALPPLTLKSRKEWDKHLWPLVKKNNPDLLEKLRCNAKRKEIVWTYSDGSSKQQLKSRKLFWTHVRTQFRNHLKSIALAKGGNS